MKLSFFKRAFQFSPIRRKSRAAEKADDSSVESASNQPTTVQKDSFNSMKNEVESRRSSDSPVVFQEDSLYKLGKPTMEETDSEKSVQTHPSDEDERRDDVEETSGRLDDFLYGISPSAFRTNSDMQLSITETEAVVQNVFFGASDRSCPTGGEYSCQPNITSPLPIVYLTNNLEDDIDSLTLASSCTGTANEPRILMNPSLVTPKSKVFVPSTFRQVDDAVHDLVKYCLSHQLDNHTTTAGNLSHLVTAIEQLSHILQNAASDDPHELVCARVFALRGDLALIKVLDVFTDRPDMQLPACRAVFHLTSVYGFEDQVGACCGIEALIKTMQAYDGSASGTKQQGSPMDALDIVTHACAALGNLLDNTPANATLFAKAGGTHCVIHAMKHYRDDAPLQRHACRLLMILCQWEEHLTVVEALNGRFHLSLAFYNNSPKDAMIEAWAHKALQYLTPLQSEPDRKLFPI